MNSDAFVNKKIYGSDSVCLGYDRQEDTIGMNPKYCRKKAGLKYNDICTKVRFFQVDIRCQHFTGLNKVHSMHL